MSETPEATSNVKTFSIVMLVIAAVAIAGACFLSNPPAFSATHIKDHSVLRTVVSLLGLAGTDGERSAVPTMRGVEIRALCFNLGAAALMLAFAAQLISSGRKPRMTVDDLFDLKHHFSGPYAWWVLLLFVSVVSSYFASAPDVALGGVLLRLLTFGWWLPLAVVLRPKEAKRLTAAMTLIITLMSVFGIWYFYGRPDGRNRLWYPVGNELWFGACLLPAIFVAAGGLLAGLQRKRTTEGATGQRIDLIVMSAVALAVCGFALWLTKSRSAAAGMYAGGCFALILLVPRKARALTLLGSILIALASVQFGVLPLLKHSAMGDRAHSVRSRLNHEWPYAMTLWFQKPVGGHGEGGYAMLAGHYARQDQLMDPNAIAIDERVWVAEAHNEYLNLLSDVGLAGTIGFVGALVATIFWTFRYVNRRRDDPAESVNRSIVIGLSAALVAVAFEEGASVALRHPGLPPLFFTTWACLWAMVRSERPAPKRRGEPGEIETRRLNPSTVRLGGVLAALASIGLVYVSIQDWRGSRAQYEAETAIADGHFNDAIAYADTAGTLTLDPMRKLVSREIGIDARVHELVRRLQVAQQNRKAPSDADLRVAGNAEVEAAALSRIAPDFLRLSTLRWQLAYARYQAHLMRNEPEDAKQYYNDYVTWLNQCRQDEPFNIEYLVRLWSELNRPQPAAQFEWLRMWLRRNGIDDDPRFSGMLQQLATQVSGFKPVLDDAVNVAKQDSEKPIDAWQDAFSPETLRIAAAIAMASGNAKQAIEDAETAAKMYESAGGRLFFAHSAALMEEVGYRFHNDPAADPTPLLKMLVNASQIRNGPLAVQGDEALKVPLPREVGEMRLAILLASGREDEARAQLEPLTAGAKATIDTRLAFAYSQLANQFAASPRFANLVTKWISRAESLDPNVQLANLARFRLALAMGNDDDALAAARQIIDKAPTHADAFDVLRRSEFEKPESGIWSVLRKNYADFPPSPFSPTTQPGSLVPGVPDVSERPNNETAPTATQTSDD